MLSLQQAFELKESNVHKSISEFIEDSQHWFWSPMRGIDYALFY